jgi:hypothetical protein
MATFDQWYAQYEHPGMTLEEEWTRDRCRLAWEEAVAAERKACAQVADEVKEAYRSEADSGDSAYRRSMIDRLIGAGAVSASVRARSLTPGG